MEADTNIEMLDDIIEGRRKWLEDTKDARVCCGAGFYASGGCFENPLMKCVYFRMAERIAGRSFSI